MSLPAPTSETFASRVHNIVHTMRLLVLMADDAGHEVARDPGNENVLTVTSSYGLARIERTDRDIIVDIFPAIGSTPNLEPITLMIGKQHISDSALFHPSQRLQALAFTILAETVRALGPTTSITTIHDIEPPRGHATPAFADRRSVAFALLSKIASAITAQLNDGDLFVIAQSAFGQIPSIGIVDAKNSKLRTERYLNTRIGAYLEKFRIYCEHIPEGVAIYPDMKNDGIAYLTPLMLTYGPTSMVFRPSLSEIDAMFSDLKKESDRFAQY